MIKYRCTLCGMVLTGVPIIHDGIEPPEGLDRGGSSAPFLHEGQWYVYVGGDLSMLVEISDQHE